METTNTYSATTLSLTAHDYIALCQAEIDRQEAHWTTNTAKACNKMRFLIQLLQSVSPDAVFSVEGCRGDTARGWTLPNAGSLVECIVKWHLCKHPEKVEKAWEGVDHVQGCIPYEIKSSIAPNALATPSEAECTLLVNACGAFIIKKADVLSYCKETKAGPRLRYNVPCGYRIDWLSDRLGFDTDNGAEE